jgi:hypothetical protein
MSRAHPTTRIRLPLFLALLLPIAVGTNALVRPRPGFEVLYSDTTDSNNQQPWLARREEPPVAWNFGDLPAERFRTGFQAHYTGKLRIRYPGTYFFDVRTNDTALLILDGAPVAGANLGNDFSAPAFAQLSRGLHPFTLVYRHEASSPPPGLSLLWSKEIDAPRPMQRDAVYGPEAVEWRFSLSHFLWLFMMLDAAGLSLVVLGLLLQPQTARRFYSAAATLCLALIFSLVFLELALRLAGVRPREYVPGTIWYDYKLNTAGATTRYMGYLPYAVKEFEVPVTMNSKGWRDREYNYEKPPGVYRIIVLGDSYVEGKEVPLEKTFHKLLERQLNTTPATSGRQFEVIALGRGGTATAAQYNFLREDGLRYRPDLVLLCYWVGNDVRESSPALTKQAQTWLQDIYIRYIATTRVDFIDHALVFKKSWLNHFLVDRLCDLYVTYVCLTRNGLTREELSPPDAKIYQRGEYPDLWKEAWETSRVEILALKNLAEKNGAEFRMTFVYSPQIPGYDANRKMPKNPAIDIKKPFRILSGLCEAAHIPYLDLEPPLSDFQARTRERYYWRYDAHWNENGHRVAAEALFRWLAPQF